jgi:hypothetical protein
MKKLILLPLLLSLVSCTSDQVTTTLEAAVDAAIAFDAIARPQDAPYLAEATNCLDQAESILASNLSTTLKSTEIGAACASAVAAGNGNVDVQAVSAALNAFLKALNVTSAQIQFSNPQMVNAFQGSKQGKISQAKLKKIRKKIDLLKKKLKNPKDRFFVQ